MTAGLTPGYDAAELDVRAIDRRLVSGIAWTAAFRWIVQVISWVATLRRAHPDARRLRARGHAVLLVRQALPENPGRTPPGLALGALAYAVVLLGFHRSRGTDTYRVIREARHI